jgi:hypothetical protein
MAEVFPQSPVSDDLPPKYEDIVSSTSRDDHAVVHIPTTCSTEHAVAHPRPGCSLSRANKIMYTRISVLVLSIVAIVFASLEINYHAVISNTMIKTRGCVVNFWYDQDSGVFITTFEFYVNEYSSNPGIKRANLTSPHAGETYVCEDIYYNVCKFDPFPPEQFEDVCSWTPRDDEIYRHLSLSIWAIFILAFGLALFVGLSCDLCCP